MSTLDNHYSFNIKNGCNNINCGCSINLLLELTFGSGKLDIKGYWECPCGTCARAWEFIYGGRCWPYPINEKQNT